jgi:hypothetical protein
MQEKKYCNNNTDIISVCMNYSGCCTDNNANINGQCFCMHPFVKKCNESYKTCMSNSKDAKSCTDILNKSCREYSKNDIMNNNFKKPINAKQTIDNICKISAIKDLDQKCMELCQTNDNCKAYTIDTGICNLYSSQTSIPIPRDESSNIIFVAKK